MTPTPNTKWQTSEAVHRGHKFLTGFKFALWITIALALMILPARAQAGGAVIIKADDFRGPSAAWTNFLEASRALGVKVSIGVIVDSIVSNSAAAEWMKAQVARGDVEFWNHGWDHKQWTDNGKTISEFGGSGLAHQTEHLAKSQKALKDALGKDVIALGTPYNAFDADTAKAIIAQPELRLFFVHNLAAAKPLLAGHVTVVDIISESDGTAKPNAEKFKALWQKRPASAQPVSLQFHPPYFDAAHLEQYKQVLEFLKAQGCTFKLPAEVAADKTS